MSDDKTHPTVTWTKKLEEHFAATGERAHCLSWGHKRSEELYSTRRTYIDLPVIVLSSVTGFCSVGQGIIFEGQDKLSSILLGVISLFVGVLNTTGSYFGWAKRTEAHRISSIHYARLYRSIKIELSLPRDERMTPTELLKFCKDQYERLAEISPILPLSVVEDFKHKFQKYVDTVSFPEEMNGLDPIEVFDPEFEAAVRQGGEIARQAEEDYKRLHPHQVLLAASSSENMLSSTAKKAFANRRLSSRRASQEIDTSSTDGTDTPVPMHTNPLHKAKSSKSRGPTIVVETSETPTMDSLASAGVGPLQSSFASNPLRAAAQMNPLSRIGASVQQLRQVAAPLQQAISAPLVQRQVQQVLAPVQQVLAPVQQQVLAPVQQVLAPIQQQMLAPVQQALAPAVQQVLAPVQQALAPIQQVLAPVQQVQAPVVLFDQGLQPVEQQPVEQGVIPQQALVADQGVIAEEVLVAEQGLVAEQPVMAAEQVADVPQAQTGGSDGAV
jgi:hypothetical protein